jgi:hypothetical protein
LKALFADEAGDKVRFNIEIEKLFIAIVNKDKFSGKSDTTLYGNRGTNNQH